MKKENYSELIKDPRWQKKRLEIMQRDEFTCQRCGCNTKKLNVHHKYYIDSYMPWQYKDDVYVTLCDYCHQFEHDTPSTPCDIANIGELYRYDHSDFTNYMICYDIDEKSKNIYLFGVDNGSGFDSIWFDVFSYDDFYKRCSIEDSFFKEDECEYFENSLLCVLDNLRKGEYNAKNTGYYINTKREPSFEIKRAISMSDTILANNGELNKAYKSYKNTNIL